MRERSAGLDAVRASAISLVLADHALLLAVGTGAIGWGVWDRYIQPIGYIGVQVFFVLSGFLIGQILQRDHARGGPWLGRFWTRRWMRTLPAYYVVLAMQAALAWGGVGSGIPDWRYLLFGQSLVAAPSAFFFESWSLAVEELFYLLLPLAVLAMSRTTSNPAAFRQAVLGFLAASIALRVAITLVYPLGPDTAWQLPFLAPVCLESMAWGVVAGTLWHARARPVTAALGAVLLTFGVALLFLRRLDPSGATTLVSLLGAQPALAVGTGLVLPWIAAARFPGGTARAAIQQVSVHSYALYLVNLPIMTLLVHGATATGLQGAWTVAWLLLWAIAVAGTARVLHLAVERPMLDLRDRWTEGARTNGTMGQPSGMRRIAARASATTVGAVLVVLALASSAAVLAVGQEQVPLAAGSGQGLPLPTDGLAEPPEAVGLNATSRPGMQGDPAGHDSPADPLARFAWPSARRQG